MFIKIPSHTHSRGQQNITGTFRARAIDINPDGTGHLGIIGIGGTSLFSSKAVEENPDTRHLSTSNTIKGWVEYITFDASKTWTGEKNILNSIIFKDKISNL